MKKILIPLLMFVIVGCDSGGSDACVYSKPSTVLYCLEYTSGSKSKFLKTCKQILTLQRLKDGDATLAAAQSCPVSPKATCLNAITDMADQHYYENPFKDMEQLRRSCESMKGTFVPH